jgi:CRP-like cAMP-binding protein
LIAINYFSEIANISESLRKSALSGRNADHILNANQLSRRDSVKKKQQEIPTPTCDTCPHLEASIYKGLSAENLEWLRANKVVRSFKRGQAIALEGHEPSGVYCILKGMVKFFRSHDEGADQVLAFVGEGHSVGATAVVCNTKLPFTASALTDGYACFVEKDAFLEFTRQAPELIYNILLVAHRYLGMKDDAMYRLTRKSVRQRVAQSLIQLSEAFSIPTAEGQLITIPLSRADLAAFSGTVLENAVRYLSEFKSEGFIATQGKQIIIIHPEKLKEISA